MTQSIRRRPLEFHDMHEVVADVQRLQDEGYDRAGNWTLSQVCDHLAIFFRGSLDGFSQKVPWLIRVLLGRMIFRWIMRRGMGEGVKVPKGFLPGDPRSDSAAAEDLIQLVERFRNQVGEYQPSPLFGRLSRDEWTRLHLIHCAHHLSFLVPHDTG
jgi:hypothetical protein